VVVISYVCREDCPKYFFEPVAGPCGESFGNEVHQNHDGLGFGLAVLVDFVNPIELRQSHLTEVFFGQGRFEVGFLGFQR
jgi:hypothetical protein